MESRCPVPPEKGKSDPAWLAFYAIQTRRDGYRKDSTTALRYLRRGFGIRLVFSPKQNRDTRAGGAK